MLFGREFIVSSPDQVDEILSGFFKTDYMAATVLATPQSLAEIGEKPVCKIDVPCLVIAGDEDTMAPLPAVRELHDSLPNSKLCLLERTGHLMNIERPEEFNEALGSFYQGRFSTPSKYISSWGSRLHRGEP